MFTNDLTSINGMYQSLLDHCLSVCISYVCVCVNKRENFRVCVCCRCNNTVIKQLVFDFFFSQYFLEMDFFSNLKPVGIHIIS